MKLLYVFMFLHLAYASMVYGCPSCIGKLDDEETPPFFNVEFYQPTSREKAKNQHAHAFDGFEEMVNETTEALQE